MIGENTNKQKELGIDSSNTLLENKGLDKWPHVDFEKLDEKKRNEK